MTRIDWPALPDIADPEPIQARRAWGKLPYQTRYRKQRRDLLLAAGRLAAQRGYQGTRISDIVAEAGLSKATFYEHFASKQECFLELYRRTNAAMVRVGIQAAELQFERGGSSYETVLAVIGAMTGYVARDPRLAEVLRVEAGAAEPAIDAQRKQNVSRVVDFFVALATKLGSPLADDELRLAATIVVQGVTSILPDLRRHRGTFDAQMEVIAGLGCRALALP